MSPDCKCGHDGGSHQETPGSLGLAYPCKQCGCQDFDDATGLAPEHARAYVTASAYGVSDLIKERDTARAERDTLRRIVGEATNTPCGECRGDGHDAPYRCPTHALLDTATKG